MTETPATPDAPAPAPVHWKLVIDSADPHAQADFWAAALHYEVEDNSAFIERLVELGALPGEATVEFHGRPAFRDLIGVRHPDDPYDLERGTGLGRRLLFQRVPEPKSGKNRLHLDLHPGEDRRAREVERLEALGASVLRHVKEPAGEWTVLTDPEGNEFCVH
ncbi:MULTISPECIES: VOC family protein [Streptomyces]|uniref:VOC family protein n=1 Tax=Streptomyces TaxID=1883 RepID=UPI0005BB365A|nr:MULTISPECIES: VOC family protein [Streptomyces]MBY8869015.1 VOC family protein [Streptomyces sennicomposti]MYS47564.1 glyoxalase/bleomycin resistance/dioxygenase family protein [Streptomyces sp. SID5998]MYX46501.1 glyoxalase/bleomycin resistance/dioxygenase family protein [Streptomyces sp. SID89]NED73794.1 glyoxalase/bleomycin resistance/dioxygenase family protein [Streptomyces sp. SID9944]